MSILNRVREIYVLFISWKRSILRRARETQWHSGKWSEIDASTYVGHWPFELLDLSQSRTTDWKIDGGGLSWTSGRVVDSLFSDWVNGDRFPPSNAANCFVLTTNVSLGNQCS